MLNFDNTIYILKDLIKIINFINKYKIKISLKNEQKTLQSVIKFILRYFNRNFFFYGETLQKCPKNKKHKTIKNIRRHVKVKPGIRI